MLKMLLKKMQNDTNAGIAVEGQPGQLAQLASPASPALGRPGGGNERCSIVPDQFFTFY